MILLLLLLALAVQLSVSFQGPRTRSAGVGSRSTSLTMGPLNLLKRVVSGLLMRRARCRLVSMGSGVALEACFLYVVLFL